MRTFFYKHQNISALVTLKFESNFDELRPSLPLVYVQFLMKVDIYKDSSELRTTSETVVLIKVILVERIKQ